MKQLALFWTTIFMSSVLIAKPSEVGSCIGGGGIKAVCGGTGMKKPAGVAFSTISDIPNLVAHGDLPTSSSTSSWVNEVSGGNPAQQATSSKRMRYMANAMKGHPALKSDGVDDEMSVTLPNTYSTFTACALVRVNTLQQYASIIGSTETSGGIMLEIAANGALDVWFNNVGASNTATTTANAVTPGLPQVLCVNYDGTTVKIFADGVQKGSGTRSGGKLDAKTYLGGGTSPQGGGYYSPNAWYSSWAVWSRALSDIEVASASTILKAKITPAPEYTNTRSVTFTGTQWINYGDYWGFKNQEPYSVSFWFKTTGPGEIGPVAKANTGTYQGWFFLMYDAIYSGDGTTAGQVRYGSNNIWITRGSTSYMNGAWHHAVGTATDNTGGAGVFCLYLDGTLQGACRARGATSMDSGVSNSSLSISSRSGAYQHFIGQVDEVAIWDRALSASDVTSISQPSVNLGGREGLKFWANFEGQDNADAYGILSGVTTGGSVSYTTDVPPGVALASPESYSPFIGSWDVTNTASVLKDGSNVVSQISDLSGTSHPMVQADSSKRPIYTASAINSKPAVKFDNANDVLTATFGTVAEFSWCLVIRFLSLTNDDFFFGSAASPALGFFEVATGSKAQVYYYQGAWPGGGYVSMSWPDNSIPINTTHNICATYKTPNLKVYKNGTLLTSSSSVTSANLGTLVGMGGSPIQNLGTDSYIGEAQVWGRELLSAEVLSLYTDYYKTKWAVP